MVVIPGPICLFDAGVTLITWGGCYLCPIWRISDLFLRGCDSPRLTTAISTVECIRVYACEMTESSESPRKRRRQTKSFKGCNACKIGKEEVFGGEADVLAVLNPKNPI